MRELVQFLSALSDIVSYAELGCAIPLNGGAYAYLRKIYGPFIGCLFSWTMIFILKPVSVAIVSLIFGGYAGRVLLISIEKENETPIWAQKAMAFLCIWSIAAINAIGPKWTTGVNSILTVAKIAALSSIAVLGMTVLGETGLFLG